MERSAAGAEMHEFVLSKVSPGAAQKRLALGVVLVLLVVFVIVEGWLATLPLRRIETFIPVYGTAIFVTDTITAVLLFAQFTVLRSRALLALANGYLLTGLIAIPWTLTFPGIIAPSGALGAGLESTVWLAILRYAVFAFSASAYSLLKEADPIDWLSKRSVRTVIIASVASIVVLVCCATVLATAGDAFLPRLMLDTVLGSRITFYVVGPIAALFLFALVSLWLRRRSVLDLWLMVVVCAYIIEIILTVFPAPIRFSLGFYAGRVYGVLANSLVLVILLGEMTRLYGQLLRAVIAQRREREVRLMTGDAVSASIAHEIKQPLSAMTANASTALNWLDRAAPDLDKAKAALQRIVTNGHRAGEVIENTRELFKRDARTRSSLGVNDLIRESLALVSHDLQTHRIAVQVDCNDWLPRIEGNQIQLQQVLVNLITNAIESMDTQDGERVLRVRSEVHDSHSVVVSVEDTGQGVEPSAIERIFNPLITTKAHGMGMGLSICRSIIEAHGGRLWATANLPRGAIFRFTLPVHPGGFRLVQAQGGEEALR